MQYLEWREKQYDLRVRVDVFGRESSAVPIVKGALTYIASADCVKNLNYAGMSYPSAEPPHEARATPRAVPVTLVMTQAVTCLTEMRCLLSAVYKGSCTACAGPAPREAIAQQIASAMGPSGPNDEYLYGLVRALQEVCAGTTPLLGEHSELQGCIPAHLNQ